MSAVNIYNPNVIGESAHGMFAIVIRVYKCNCYSIITYNYAYTVVPYWNIVMVATTVV